MHACIKKACARQYFGFVSILLLISGSFGMTLTSVGADPSTILSVNPQKTEFWIPACGETFKINVSIADVSNLQGFEFKLYWNTTLLDLVEREIHPFLNPTFFPFRNELDETLGRYWLNITTIDGPPASGSGPLATLSFQVTYEPIWPKNATCDLNLVDTKLVDPNGNSIQHDVAEGEYWCSCTSFLSLAVTTDKTSYDVNETIHVYGNLTRGFSPVQDGLVALEIDDPQDEVIVVRTLNTSTPPAGQIVEIVDVTPCGGPPDYNPRSWFYRGTTAYFNTSVRNNDIESHKVLVTGNVYDVNLTPLGYVASAKTLAGGSTSWGILSFYIEGTVSVGDAGIYAGAFTGWPRNHGTAYCPEELATFEIRESGGGAAAGAQQSLGSGSEGPYNLTFKLPSNATDGIYQVSASVSYQELSASGRTAFAVDAILVPDYYSSIQGAVDAATPTNNSILVMPGTYNEHVTINQALTLVARDQRAGRTIVDGSGTGTVVTVDANGVMVSGFTIRNSGSLFADSGVDLTGSSGSTLSENTIFMNHYGMKIRSSDNNYILDNRLTGNNYGIHLNRSTGNTLKYNSLCNNHSFGVFGDSISYFTHAVDTSNTVNGKPVIYWIDQHNSEVPPNAGFVAIVSSTNISVRALDLTKNIQGLLFVFTNDSVIERVNFVGNEYGIYLFNSDGNTIIGSEVSNSFVGIYQWDSDGNTIYHNNFINNINQADLHQSSNTWDDGDGKGNYWSDYTGVDDGSGGRTAGDGVGDTLLPHQDVDWYPLMQRWIVVHDVAVTNVIYTVKPYDTSAVPAATGWKVVINVTVKNEGDSIETFDVSAYANTTVIGTLTDITLPVRSSTTVTLRWNLHEYVPIGNYTISAYAWPVPGEIDSDDNTYIDGTIEVVEMSNPDVNGDGIVDIVDIVIVALAFGSEPGDPNWNPEADLNFDSVVDIVDIVIVAIHFGETSP